MKISYLYNVKIKDAAIVYTNTRSVYPWPGQTCIPLSGPYPVPIGIAQQVWGRQKSITYQIASMGNKESNSAVILTLSRTDFNKVVDFLIGRVPWSKVFSFL